MVHFQEGQLAANHSRPYVEPLAPREEKWQYVVTQPFKQLVLKPKKVAEAWS